MTSSKSSVLQLDDDQDPQSELQFQDFTLGGDPDVATLSPSGSFYKDGLDSPSDENADLLGGEKTGSSSFWQFSYYQSFFDIDTEHVVQRIMWSMVPLPGRATFLDRQIRPKPDMYGPFWIATTLVFSTAICANIANYLTNAGRDSKWTYDFHKVSLAATAIYSYTFLLPVLLWGLMWYRQSSNRYSLLEILCVYGYSLAIYVPISVLWIIQVSWFQWILVIVGAILSGTVLIQTFWPIFKEDNKKIAAVVLCLILVFHTLLAVGFVTYFFHSSYGAVHHTRVSASPSSILTSEKAISVIEESSFKPTAKSMALIVENKTEKQTNEINQKLSNKIKTMKLDQRNITFPFNSTDQIGTNVAVAG